MMKTFHLSGVEDKRRGEERKRGRWRERGKEGQRTMKN
jgi:hypothetical protein